MANVKNRRLTIGDTVYRWSSFGNMGGIAIVVGLDGDRPDRQTGRRILSTVPHNTLVLPSLVRRLIDEARAAGWRPEQPHIEPFLHVLEAPFLDLPPGRRKEPRNAEPDDEEYLAAIRAAPDDDGPRLVYADALLERGDLRGELIVLSCRSAGPEPSAHAQARMSELLQQHESSWLGPLSYVTRVRKWQRGFLAEAELTRRERGVVAPAIGDPRWWSVRKLEARSAFLADRDVASILAAAPFDDLEELTVEANVLPLLIEEGDGWVPRTLHIAGGDFPGVDTLAAVAAMPRLRHLRTWLSISPAQARHFGRPGLSFQIDNNAYSFDAWRAVSDAFEALYLYRQQVR